MVGFLSETMKYEPSRTFHADRFLTLSPRSPPPRFSLTKRCLEHGFEYIEADLCAPVSTEGTREKEGVARVVEAMEATSWRSIVLRERGHRAPETAGLSTSGAEESCLSVGAEGAEMSEPAEGLEVEKGVVETEKSVDELEAIFDKVREVRASAGQVSDSERRKRAAETALRLAKALGVLDDSD